MKIYVVFHIIESNEFCCNLAKTTGHGYIQKAFSTREEAENFCNFLKEKCKHSKSSEFSIKEITLD